MSLASSEQPAIGSSEFGTLNYAFLSILWLAFFAQWATVIPTIVPDQVRVILGPNGANYQELIAGGIIAASNVLALVIPPIAGALSDRSRSPRGRRRPFLIVGILGACVGLLLLLPFGQGDSPILYGLVILNLQLWWNWAAGPYAGLVTDMVPATGRVAASGWLNVMTIVGSAVGNGLMAALYIAGQPLRVVVIFIVINLLCLWITLVRVHEPPAAATVTLGVKNYIRTFFPDLNTNTNFYWVLLTRLLAQLGIWPIFIFFLYYLEKVIGIPPEIAPNLQNGLLLLAALVAIPAALLANRLIKRHGMVRVVGSSSWVIAIAAFCYAAIAFHPSLVLVVPILVVFSAGYGAYIAADWALALCVLPSGGAAGKDMGIWHVSLVLPQIVGSAVIGWMITELSPWITTRFAYASAFALCGLLPVAASVLINRIRCTKDTADIEVVPDAVSPAG